MSKRMTKLYEKHWNNIVEEMAPWKKELIINNFDVIDGHHVYRDKQTQDIANYVAHECAKRAESEEYDILKKRKLKKN